MKSEWWRTPVKQLHAEYFEAAHNRQQILTKPPGSLGQLERIAEQLCAMQATTAPVLDKVMISVFAADHGIADEGVSAFPQAVTAEMVRNFASGGAAISVLAREIEAVLEVVNVGTVSEVEPLAGVVDQRIAAGTANFARNAAMSEDQLLKALQSGYEAAERARQAGCQLFIAGEMGIANTTAATAMACAMLQCSAHELAGPGTGLDEQGVKHKANIIDAALSLHKPDSGDVLQIMRSVGGFEIAAITGACIHCAQSGIAVLVDGFIATAAAMAAARLSPEVTNWFLYAHASAEPGHGRMLHSLGADPLLDLGMRLGEGSGAATAVPVMRLAVALHNGMATFADAGVSEKQG